MLLLYSLINFIYQVIKKNFLKMCSHLWWLESEAFNVHIQINEKKIDETFFSRLSYYHSYILPLHKFKYFALILLL